MKTRNIFKAVLFFGVAFTSLAVCAEAVPVTIAPAPTPTWIDKIGGWPVILPILVAFLVRLENFFKARYGVKVDSAVSAAHSVFNALWDLGVIKNGKFKEAESMFWEKLQPTFKDAHDKVANSQQESIAHAEFVKLFTENTEPTIPPKVD